MTIFSSKAFKILFAVACVVVLSVSLLPGKQLPANLIWDKAGHFIAYMGLAGICKFASNKHPMWQLFIGIVAFSFVIELLQQLIPNRGFEWMDMVANGLGTLVGLLLAKLVKPLFFKDK